MKAHVLLADAAQLDGMGKVGALGLGWSMTSTPTPPHAVVLALRLGWEEAAMPHDLEFVLVARDGSPVTVAASEDRPQSLRIALNFEVSRPSEAPHGLDIDHNIAFNVGPGLMLEPGQHYEWRLSIDGHHEPDWSAPFYVRSQT